MGVAAAVGDSLVYEEQLLWEPSVSCGKE